MKVAGKFGILILLAALVLLPLQVAQAKGLADGPIFGENYTLKSGETLLPRCPYMRISLRQCARATWTC